MDDKFVINNVTLIQGKENVFVAMPSYRTKQKDKDGKTVYKDICFPVTKEFREKLYGEVIESYYTAVDLMVLKDDFTMLEGTDLPIMKQDKR